MIRVGALMGSRRNLGDQSLQTVSHREHSATKLQGCGDLDAAAGALLVHYGPQMRRFSANQITLNH
jgi:hypothetical protein